MHTFWTLPLVLLLALLAPPAWGGDKTASDYVAQRWADCTRSGSQTDSKQVTPPLYQTRLTPTFFAAPVASPRLRDLAPETDQPRTKGLLSSTTWLNGTFITETEVAQSLGGAGWLQSRIPGDTRGDAAQRMVRLGLTGTAGSVRYGALYRSAEQAFLNGPDLAMREVWGEWKSGSTTLRSAIGEQWNNVAGDSTRSRLGQTYGRVGLAWKRPTWPELTLTYARNSLNSALEPLGIIPRGAQPHLESALAYNGMRWNARLAELYPRERSPSWRSGDHGEDADAHSSLSPFEHPDHFPGIGVSGRGTGLVRRSNQFALGVSRPAVQAKSAVTSQCHGQLRRHTLERWAD
jgi:hypothetical protein